MDSGYDVTRLAFLLADLPVELVGRLRSDRVMRCDRRHRRPGTSGRPPQARRRVRTSPSPTPGTSPNATTTTDTTRYGKATAHRLGPDAPPPHPPRPLARPRRRTPVIHGTLIRLKVEHLPGDRDPKPVWLWSSTTGATTTDVDRCWQAFLRRFDLEHTFRLFKQTLGWTSPKTPQPSRRRPVDLADHRRPHPTPPRPPPRRGPPPALGTPGPTPPAHPRPGPAGVSQPPPEDRPSRQCTQTRPTRPRTPTRLEKPPPGPRHDVGKTTKRGLTVTARQQPQVKRQA